MRMRRNWLSTVAGWASVAALAAMPTCMRAAEQVTLKNGFGIRCDHHAPMEGHVRLYLSRGGDNYIEFRPEEIAAVESVPDLPEEAAAARTNAHGAPDSNSKADAKLSPADLAEMLAKAGQAHNLDVDLLGSVVKAESGGNVRAQSRAGARGLMQLMPGTATQMGVADSFKADENVRGGSTYLDALLTRYHDNLALALAAYNAGPAAVDKYGGIPPYRETRLYVARVIHEFNRRVQARQTRRKRSTASVQGN